MRAFTYTPARAHVEKTRIHYNQNIVCDPDITMVEIRKGERARFVMGSKRFWNTLCPSRVLSIMQLVDCPSSACEKLKLFVVLLMLILKHKEHIIQTRIVDASCANSADIKVETMIRFSVEGKQKMLQLLSTRASDAGPRKLLFVASL